MSITRTRVLRLGGYSTILGTCISQWCVEDQTSWPGKIYFSTILFKHLAWGTVPGSSKAWGQLLGSIILILIKGIIGIPFLFLHLWRASEVWWPRSWGTLGLDFQICHKGYWGTDFQQSPIILNHLTELWEYSVGERIHSAQNSLKGR